MSGLYDRILVPLDGSKVASQALPYALQLAAQSGAELVLLHVIPNLKPKVTIRNNMPFVDTYVEHQHFLVEEAESSLQRLADDLGMHGIKAHAVIDVGEAAERIIACSMDDIDMIVMSTHGRTGLARWRYASVAGKVMSAVTCPVLLVHSQLAEPPRKEEVQKSAVAA